MNHRGRLAECGVDGFGYRGVVVLKGGNLKAFILCMRHEPFHPRLRPNYHAAKHLWENRETPRESTM